MNNLKDSGKRTTFNSGATRELTSDKGRCDLLPLEQIAVYYEKEKRNQTAANIFYSIDRYVRTLDKDFLYIVINRFILDYYNNDAQTAFLELAKHYQDALPKYSERNWEKGLPLHSFIDSGVRHYLKYLRGDTDEPHDRAFLWNMFGAIWTQANHPECIDLFTCINLPAQEVTQEEIRNKNALQYIAHLSNVDYGKAINSLLNDDKKPHKLSHTTCEGCKYHDNGNIYTSCNNSNTCHRRNDGTLTGYEKKYEKLHGEEPYRPL